MSYVFDLFAYYATVASFRGYWNLLEYYLPSMYYNSMSIKKLELSSYYLGVHIINYLC